MKLNLVEDIDDVKEKGDAIIVVGIHSETKEKILQLIICCPQCGVIKFSAKDNGNHIYDEATKTYTPSIIHDVKYGGCGWHGWLTNGEFISC